MNLCLGSADFVGGGLEFAGVRSVHGLDDRAPAQVQQRRGRALLHVGQHLHKALPLTRGVRENVILWAYGENGFVRAAPYDDAEVAAARNAKRFAFVDVT